MIKKIPSIFLPLFFMFFAVQHSDGQTLLDTQYDEVKQINSDIYIVKSGDRWGVVDQSNSIKIPIEQKSLHLDDKVYHYIFKSQNDKFGISDVLCNRITEAIYDSITIFRITDGKYYLKCWENGVSAVFDQHKGLLFTQNCADFRKIPFENNLFIAQNAANKWGLINGQSTSQMPFKYDTLILQQNKAIHYKTPEDKKLFFAVKVDHKFGLIDYSDKTILPFEYDGIEVLHENHFIIRKDQNFGSIDSTGEAIIPLEYQAMELFPVSDGAATYIKVLNNNQLAGLYDKTGKQIIEEKYLYDSFVASCHTIQQNLGRSIEANDGENNYFFYLWNDYEPIEFTEKEAIGNGIHCNYIYSLANNKMCFLGGNPKNLCSSSFEFFDDYDIKEVDDITFLILSNKDDRGRMKYGVRELREGACLSSIIFDRLDYNITKEMTDYFNPGRNEAIIAVGHIKKGNQRWIISNRGAKEMK